jgi:predicted RNA binding protein YcfA (HicA-like mRNA interferase family)
LNIVQHFLWRTDVFEELSSERPKIVDAAHSKSTTSRCRCRFPKK